MHFDKQDRPYGSKRCFPWYCLDSLLEVAVRDFEVLQTCFRQSCWKEAEF